MTLLINLKKLGVNTTLLATSISLVACGGGGSDGYYNNGSSNNNTGGDGSSGSTEGNTSETNTAQVVDSIAVQSIRDAEGNAITKVNDGSVVEFSIQILNKDKGGIEGKNVTLSIADTEKLGVTSENSTVTTTAGGYATFKLNIPQIANKSGKVQLTTTVAGTTIQQTYTLNIFKTSQMQSEYEIKAQQGVVLNIPNGSATISATVTDKNGGVKADQDVTLSLPATMLGKFSITPGSSLKTNAQGVAEFTIKANSDLTADDIKQLTATSEELIFTLVDEHKAQKTVQGAITFKDVSQVVQKLEIIKEDKPVVAQGGKTVVKVRAKNSNDVALANKKVKLLFTDLSDAYGVKIDKAEAQTDAQGYATFTLTTNSTYPLALSQQGINIRAVYTENNQEVFAQDTITVITENTNSSDELALQRLEVQSSYKINAKNDSVVITVKGVNNKGEAATQGKVTLTLNAEAVSNAVTFNEAATQQFKNGYVSYTLNTGAKTQAAVDALVQAGITATFTTDNNISTNVKIAVEDEAKSEEAVRYLLVDPINTAFDYTQEQKITVKVKAVGVKGSALKGETVSVALPSLAVSDLQALGLSLSGSSSALTQEDGYATFTYSYKPNGSARQKELLADGIRITAKSESNTNAQQTLTLNFKAPTDNTEIDLDYFAVDMPGSAVLSVGQEYTFNVTVNAQGTDNLAYAGQKIGIGFSEVALNNGVSLASQSAIVTGTDGKAVFSVKVKANNTTELANLITNGITVGLIGQRKDGSTYTVSKKIDVSQPAVVFQNLVSLDIVAASSISVLGGETRVKVIAKDADGNAIPNTPIALALSSLTSSRVRLSDIPTYTNSNGEAEFTVIVVEGAYDPELVKKGITFAVVGTNLNNGDRLQQTSTIQVTVPDEAFNLRLTADSRTIEFGQTQKIKVAVKNELGFNEGGVPVSLTLPDQVKSLGITLNHDAVLVSQEGDVVVEVNVPQTLTNQQKDALLALGSIAITGSIKKPNGEAITSTLNFEILNPQNPYFINLDLSRLTMSSAGSSSVVTAKLVDRHGGAIANQDVQLSLANFIEDNAEFIHNIYIDGPSTVQTDEKGNAEFTVVIPPNADSELIRLLEANGITVTASHTDKNGAIRTQRTNIPVFSPAAQTFPQHAIKVKSVKPSLTAVGDTTDIIAYVVDEDGGAVVNQIVSLNIANAANNGMMIVGPSMLATNEVGEAKFTVRFDPSLIKEPTTLGEVLSVPVIITATHNNGERNITQPIELPIIRNDRDIERLSIVIARDTTNLIEDATREYYLQNISVAVQDPRGNPVPQQQIQMDVDAVAYMVGEYTYGFPLDPNRFIGVIADWFRDVNQMWHPDTQQPLGPLLTAIRCPVPRANLDGFINIQNMDSGQMRKVPTNVVDFVGHETQGNVLYTTDERGRVDLQIRYPKRFATWVSVELAASSINTTQPDITHYSFTLPILNSDITSTTHPAIESPYLGLNTWNGTNYTCAP